MFVFAYTFALETGTSPTLDTNSQQKRNRIISLSFASLLLLLLYGPLANWFVAADRVLYDQLAGGMPNEALKDTYIASIDARR